MSDRESNDRDRKWDTSYLRKIRKPIIERKRRSRINKCLVELKEILLDNMKRNGDTQIAKLDKADILEMTVSHLRHIQQQQFSVAMAASTSCLQQYQQGFSECAHETIRYMAHSDSYTGRLTSSVNSHLTNILQTQNSNQFRTISSMTTEDLSENTPESPQRKCRSASPSVSRRLQFSPVPRSSTGQQMSGHVSLDSDSFFRNSLLRIPPRLPADADDTSPQRNVWRPF